MSTPAKGHHPAPKPILEQSTLETKAALATSPDKQAQQQAYPNALAHDTAQESLDNPTGLQEEQPANPPTVVPPTLPKPKHDKTPAAKQVATEVADAGKLAAKKKEDLLGTPPTMLQSEADEKLQAKTLDFGAAGSLKIASVGQRHYGVGGPEYSVTVELAKGQTHTFRDVPADLLK